MVRDSGDKISAEEKETVEKAIEQAKKDIQAENADDIRKALETLSKTTEPIVTKLYQNASAGAQNAGNASDAGNGADGDSVNVDPSQYTTEDNK